IWKLFFQPGGFELKEPLMPETVAAGHTVELAIPIMPINNFSEPIKLEIEVTNLDNKPDDAIRIIGDLEVSIDKPPGCKVAVMPYAEPGDRQVTIRASTVNRPVKEKTLKFKVTPLDTLPPDHLGHTYRCVGRLAGVEEGTVTIADKIYYKRIEA